MTPSTAMQFALAIPLVGTLLILLAGRIPNLRDTITILTSVALFYCVVQIIVDVMGGGRPELTLLEIFPGLPIAFQAEPLGAVFAGIASLLWIATSFYAIGYMRGHHEENQTRFFACFAIAIASAMGVALADNMMTLFVFYEVLSVSTYPLVTHAGTPEAKRAGRIYLGILLGTSIGLQLVAIGWTYVAAGTLDFTPGGILSGKVSDTVVGVLAGLYAFGIGKAALMPFHRWLPAAMVAPTPVSALLHAVAVVKAGVFTILKVAIYIFGLDLLSRTGSGVWIAYVAAATIVIASLVAMTKDNLKARLAYSTVSQLSYIVLGAMLATSAGVVGGAMHIVMHAFGKITLFFCAGAIMVATHKTEISQMNGLGRRMPFTFIAFFIASLSIIGLPPLGGAWSKWELSLGAAESGHILLLATYMISSILNIAYLLPVAVRGFMPARGSDAPQGWKIEEAPMFCVIPLCLTAIGSVALFFLAEPLYEFVLPIAHSPESAGVVQ
ncbi:MAG: monovalent cation/H+ antiporter subunit D family protein [Geminicoccaceae bacterium]|nr:monovalent cation/H+ antiporter subunit D family protein [Geminicoccaceae bacterium]